mgnify:CR=1 FL=1|jgi:hypothetical protein
MYQISSEVYLDKYNECYKNILVITPAPLPKDKALMKITKQLHREKLSPFEENTSCCYKNNCITAFKNMNNCNELLTVDQISILFGYLIRNGYIINTEITKMMQQSQVVIPNLICFVSKRQ